MLQGDVCMYVISLVWYHCVELGVWTQAAGMVTSCEHRWDFFTVAGGRDGYAVGSMCNNFH